MSKENFYLLYLTDPGAAINPEIVYSIRLAQKTEIKHANSRVQVTKAMDCLELISLYSSYQKNRRGLAVNRKVKSIKFGRPGEEARPKQSRAKREVILSRRRIPSTRTRRRWSRSGRRPGKTCRSRTG